MQWIEQLQGQTVALDTAPLIIFEYSELTSQRLRDRSSSHLQNSKLLAAALRYRILHTLKTAISVQTV
jgi:hypothetical protein